MPSRLLRRSSILALTLLMLVAGCPGETSVDAGLDASGSDAGLDAAGSDASGDASDAPALDGGQSADGEPCTSGGECRSGFCADGVCCSAACEGACLACTAAATGMPDGTCAPVSAGSDPESECPAQPADSCGAVGGCNGDATAPGCILYDDTTACGALACTDGLLTTAGLCDGLGTCVVGDAVPCAPYACAASGDACRTDCTAIEDCDAASYCSGGACVPREPLGTACLASTDCESGHCVDGVCCDGACDGGCDVCSAALGAAGDGLCSPATRGSAGSGCGASELCDGTSSACVPACLDASTALTRRPIDIIFVVDNSGSMTEEIVAMENAMNADFASVMDAAGIDYRVILVARHGSATAAQSICIEPPLSGLLSCSPVPSQPVNTERFRHYSTEIGSLNAWCRVLTTFTTPDEFALAPTGWSAWLREDAFKEIVVVTDDNSSCITPSASFPAATTPAQAEMRAAEIDAALRSLSPLHFGTAEERNYEAQSFVGLAPGAPVTAPYESSAPIVTAICPSSVNAGLTHQAMSVLTGGARYPVCETSSYGTFFADLASRFVHTDCRYRIPAPAPGEVIDEPTLSTQVTLSGGAATLVPRVADESACSGEGYFVSGETVVLCPTSCAAVGADAGAEVRVRYLCE